MSCNDNINLSSISIIHFPHIDTRLIGKKFSRSVLDLNLVSDIKKLEMISPYSLSTMTYT